MDSAEVSTWSNVDIGAVGLAGSVGLSGNVFTTKGAGVNIGTTADAYNFTCKKITGNCTVIARVANVANPLMAKVGLVMQETLGVAPKMASVFYDCHYQYLKARAYFRVTEGANGGSASSTLTGLPIWLKLVRSGNTFTGYASSDGVNWTTVATGTVGMNSTMYVGLFDTSRSTTQYTTVTFDNVSVTTP